MQLPYLPVCSLPPTSRLFTIQHAYLIMPQRQKNAFTGEEMKCRHKIENIHSSLKVGLVSPNWSHLNPHLVQYLYIKWKQKFAKDYSFHLVFK